MRTLGDMPDAVTISTRPRAQVDIGGVVRRVGLRRSTRAIVIRPRSVGASGSRVAWPKRASGVATDLTENIVRDAALPHGIVDYKVCAIDATWSGLKFARRKT